MIKVILFSIISLFTRKKWILLESESDMCDSTKTLFDKMIALGLNKIYKFFWCVEDVEGAKDKNKQKNVFFLPIKKNSFKKKVVFTLAKYVVYTHRFVGNRYNKRQIRVFTTHAAMPIKNSSGWFGNPRLNTYILGTSSECISYRKKSLGESDNYVITGLPRNDDLFLKKSDALVSITKGMKYIIWMPTFKHHRESTRNDFGIKVENDVSLLTEENINRINNKMKEAGMLLIIKPHPSQDLSYLNYVELSNVKTISNRTLLTHGINPYVLLGNSEALVTDFSSVYLDYLLLDKPIAFELNDQEKYKNGIGYIMDNPESFMGGQKLFNVNDFLNFIDDVLNKNDNFKAERKDLRDRIHLYQDEKSSERVLELLGLL